MNTYEKTGGRGPTRGGTDGHLPDRIDWEPLTMAATFRWPLLATIIHIRAAPEIYCMRLYFPGARAKASPDQTRCSAQNAWDCPNCRARARHLKNGVLLAGASGGPNLGWARAVERVGATERGNAGAARAGQ